MDEQGRSPVEPLLSAALRFVSSALFPLLSRLEPASALARPWLPSVPRVLRCVANGRRTLMTLLIIWRPSPNPRPVCTRRWAGCSLTKRTLPLSDLVVSSWGAKAELTEENGAHCFIMLLCIIFYVMQIYQSVSHPPEAARRRCGLLFSTNFGQWPSAARYREQ